MNGNPAVSAFFRDFSARFSKSFFSFYIMSRKTEDSDLTSAQTNAIVNAVNNYNVYYFDVAKIVNCSQLTVESFIKRVYKKIDKKNISFF